MRGGWRLCSTALRNRRCRVASSMTLRGSATCGGLRPQAIPHSRPMSRPPRRSRPPSITLRQPKPPIAGVVPAAMVIEDALRGELQLWSVAPLHQVLAPKIVGAINLHSSSRDAIRDPHAIPRSARGGGGRLRAPTTPPRRQADRVPCAVFNVDRECSRKGAAAAIQIDARYDWA